MKNYIYFVVSLLFVSPCAFSIDLNQADILAIDAQSAEDLKQLVSQEHFNDTITKLIINFKNRMLDDIRHLGLDREDPLVILSMVAVLRSHAAQMYLQSKMVQENCIGLEAKKNNFSFFEVAMNAFDSKMTFKEYNTKINSYFTVSESHISSVENSLKETSEKLGIMPDNAVERFIVLSMLALSVNTTEYFAQQVSDKLHELSQVSSSLDRRLEIVDSLSNSIFEKSTKHQENLLLQTFKEIIFPSYSPVKSAGSTTEPGRARNFL